MKNSRRLYGLTAFSLILLSAQSVLAQSQADLERLNRNWGNIEKSHPNLNKQYKVGDIQKAGEIQKSGDIKIPRGLQAITRKTEDCNQRFTVGADTLFEFDKATLTSFAVETLNALKPMIVKLGPHPIKIEGHTDGKGTDEYNQGLSERRAERVKNWLLENHVCGPEAVSTEGFGKKKPVAPNTKPDGSDNPQGRALNRRVEIVVDTCKKLEAAPSSSSSSLNSNGTTASTSESVDNTVWLPSSNVISDEEVKTAFTRMKVTPLNNKQLYFEILVPNNWDSKPLEVPPDVLKDDEHNQVPLAQLEPNGSSDKAMVEVRYMRVPEDVSLTRFVRKYADATGFQLVTRQQGTFNDRPVEDVLLKKETEKLGSELTRLTASRRGPLVMFVASSCPEKDYEKWKRTFAAAAITFNPSGD